VLHVLLALDCVSRGRKDFEVDKSMDVESFGVTFDEPIAMFVYAANEIAGHADIDCAAGPAREDVEIELPHAPSLPKRDGRDKPGHDE
jgi:hypothetical protein